MHARNDLKSAARRAEPARPAPAPAAQGLPSRIGNAAMGRLLQAKPKSKQPKQPAKPKYKPYELSEDQMDWSFERIHGWAGDRYKEKNFRVAAAFFEAAYWKKPGRQLASSIMMCFRELKAAGVEGADEMYEYWGGVANGAVKPTPPPWLQHA